MPEVCLYILTVRTAYRCGCPCNQLLIVVHVWYVMALTVHLTVEAQDHKLASSQCCVCGLVSFGLEGSPNVCVRGWACLHDGSRFRHFPSRVAAATRVWVQGGLRTAAIVASSCWTASIMCTQVAQCRGKVVSHVTFAAYTQCMAGLQDLLAVQPFILHCFSLTVVHELIQVPLSVLA
jgi:hypothetical protein